MYHSTRVLKNHLVYAYVVRLSTVYRHTSALVSDKSCDTLAGHMIQEICNCGLKVAQWQYEMDGHVSLKHDIVYIILIDQIIPHTYINL